MTIAVPDDVTRHQPKQRGPSLGAPIIRIETCTTPDNSDDNTSEQSSPPQRLYQRRRMRKKPQDDSTSIEEEPEFIDVTAKCESSGDHQHSQKQGSKVSFSELPSWHSSTCPERVNSNVCVNRDGAFRPIEAAADANAVVAQNRTKRPSPFTVPITPIVTPLRAEYTSITDDIDTSGLTTGSPCGSPTTPRPIYFGVDVNVDLYTKKRTKVEVKV